MDISKARCPDCNQPLKVMRMTCPSCDLAMEDDFEISPLAQLCLDDQAFVMAFVRHHGSIKKMESIFGISYPTVKNRLNSISASFDKSSRRLHQISSSSSNSPAVRLLWRMPWRNFHEKRR